MKLPERSEVRSQGRRSCPIRQTTNRNAKSPQRNPIRLKRFRFESEAPAKPAKPRKEKAPKEKIDPKFVAAARELRDRYLEQVNEHTVLLSQGKYDVSPPIALNAPSAQPMPMLPAA